MDDYEKINYNVGLPARNMFEFFTGTIIIHPKGLPLLRFFDGEFNRGVLAPVRGAI